MSGVADQQATLAALLRGDVVLVPRSFIGASRDRPGPLAGFVRRHRGRAMDLYLLALAAAGSEPELPRIPAAVWARALGLDATSGEPIVSRLWQWLEGEDLIVSRRVGRHKVIELVLGDEPSLGLSSGFFRGNFHNRLPIPAKAMLLVGLAEEGSLRVGEETSELYGLSRDTIRRGLSALTTVGLLRARMVGVVAPLSARGFAVERVYVLLPPFGRPSATPAHRA